MKISKIISGGQTGVDRASLDFAIKNNIKYEGFCPKGRKAEDGIIDKKYKLTETKSENYYIRTDKNIKISDGTLIIIKNNIWGRGTLLTKKYCKKQNKKSLVIDIDNDINDNINKITGFIEKYNIRTLNIAGNRESTSPGVYKQTKDFLTDLFKKSL